MLNQGRLSQHDGSRSNNFTTLRLLFAWLVIYGHAFAIQGPGTAKDPLNNILQGSTWIGALAVCGFFAISGFLVTASLVNRNILTYVVARALRIYPALIACVFLTAILFGLFFSSLSIGEYFSHQEFYKYLRNALAFDNMRFTLPGVFEEQRNTAINGSLWSLTLEIHCYILLAIVGALGLLRKQVLANIVIFGLTALSVIIIYDVKVFDSLSSISTQKIKWIRTAEYFLLGAAFYINRKHIPIDYRLFALACLVSGLAFGEEWFNLLFPLSFTYIIIFLVYAPPVIALDKWVGDISYGVYIYAWPIQQCVNYWLPDLSPYGNTAVSTLLVLPIAYLSWKWIELPAINLKTRTLP